METDVMIRELKYKANKHKNDRLDTFTTDITAMCNDVIPKLELLKSYEDIGLTPEQLLEIDKMYSEKCREVAELRKQLSEKTTAYDVDKVIEKLENRIVQYEIVKKEKPQDIYDRIHNVSVNSFIRAYKAAIKIVKAGGADE